MRLMTSQILKSEDFTKTQKSRYFENETFFLQLKQIINYTSRTTLLQKKNFVAEVTLNSPKTFFLIVTVLTLLVRYLVSHYV